MQTKLARFTREVVALAQKAVVGNAKPAVQRGTGGYADWVIVSIHGLKTYLDLPYRRLLDVLHEMPRIARILGLERSQLPDFTTVCARMQTLKMPLWRTFLRLSAELHDTGEIQAIDATGMDRIAASQHYAKRTNYTFRAVKTTALIDCETGAILDIHCSMTQPHDSQVAWQLLTRNLDKLSILTADKGYDWELLRHKLRSEGVKPVIKYREFGWHGVANNVLLDDTIYHQRSNIEATFFALRRKYGEIVRARTWYGQFRELVLKCTVRNIELALSASNA
ncbi:IS5 family transposase [Halobacterium salinarum]|uniref:IS5 family transposase n=1 Tax=Halobacterium salinarum TaxID=2242 RepID=UPI002556C0AE|nr:IS5 family transposase [Halobacterium salinarum]MDL0122139.1 IS5 family transposase [Halobacterium salinarum]MDL0129131.1 IS5 family transposase [Halobacterium salinarum]MDL0139119.1 IS5 family transposase [Halobacterium salinarum]